MVGIERSEACHADTAVASPVSTEASYLQRPTVRGKYLFVGETKLWVRGVTYGTFRPDTDGNDYHDPKTVERDFAQMAEHGLNTVRTYTPPPRWLLDIAQQYGLRVMVGLPWEQHIAFLDDKKRVRDIEARVRAGIQACAGHAAVLCYAIGNEIPAPIVRWYGNRRIEQFLHRLYRAAKAEDPGGLVTYVNYPTTEYLHLPFLDLVCFNVYLETEERLEAYLSRLQNIAGDRPLLMGEIGLDSRRNGDYAQAEVLEWQIRTIFSSGCIGALIFAWTDEWYRGGHDITDWDFGLTDRQRCPKPALAAVSNAFTETPFPADLPWPRMSVVICTYNGARTIRDCCEGLLRLDYPNFEVIVINDGSTDATADIVSEYPFRLISTENRGLCNARNRGWQESTGEIVAYTDDDAYPDPHWLTYLAVAFMRTEHVGIGGPNLPPPGDGPIADCVANAPGGPVHVLLSDTEAEHIPGCNMSFRRAALQAIGGFDPQFRVAGDDVDICWRLQQQGWTIGFSPAAMVWHHRRNSVKTYWKQQQGYGKAEALLEKKWPEKYNMLGHLSWAGRLYGTGSTRVTGLSRGRIYQGTWGSALFQSVYKPAPGFWGSLPLMPEWYLVIAALATLSVLGLAWKPLLLALPVLGYAVGILVIQAALSATHASFSSAPSTRWAWLKLWGVTTGLHLMQPLARLRGRWIHGLTPWRWQSARGLAWPWARTFQQWREEWQCPMERLEALEETLRAEGIVSRRGGDYDRWDLEVRGGILGAARLLSTTEEHGAGRQLVRFRLWPKCSWLALGLIVLLLAGAGVAASTQGEVCALILLVAAVLPVCRMLQECAGAMATAQHALKHAGAEDA
ncbi:MAG: glycosyltransferase [Candidatus Tectomicrobia bacterium]|uniref:Glycosyltransferase n=1 Tax=Tectimicrobiota bacterium TaxID=2528274 RepID=A0A937W5D7_UNCTE|nr:glycosyltransferase [Candidatus Tectomicrobia bacterium]